MKRLIIVLALVTASPSLWAQHTIEQCHRLAKANYPIAAQRALIEKSLEYTLENASKGYIPQVSLSMRATLQSEVTSIPIELPGLKSIPKDQYQGVVEVNQTIWDGGVIRSSKESARASTDVERKRLESNLYALNERVDNLFFGILILDEQLKLNTLINDELQRNLSKVEAYIMSGVASGPDRDAVQVEILNNRQSRDQITNTRKAYLAMLEALTGTRIESLLRPELSSLDTSLNNRPELMLFDAQNTLIDTQKEALRARNLPRIGAFVQGAYGNPGLDMLKAGFTPYAVGGVRLSWNFSGYYTQRNEIKKIDIQKESLASERRAFLLNNKLLITQVQGDQQRILDQIALDDSIIALRHSVRLAAQAKVALGTMTVNDMLRELTAENSARQGKATRQVDLLYSIYKLKNLTNQ